MEKIIECVPNFSEGIKQEIINQIMSEASKIPDVNVLDYSMDKDHNRSVLTFVGSPEGVEEAAFNMVKVACELIDMRQHKGEHPRMGSTDVLPLIPIKNVTMKECVEMAQRLGKRIGSELGIPVFLYEEAAQNADRKNLADVRKGEYEGFFEKLKKPEWKPDFGPDEMNAKNGCMAVGARFPLVAYNVNLSTSDIAVANNIAKIVRHIGGGLRFVKAMGVKLEERGIVQVSMNLVNYEKTSIYRAHEMVKMEAKRYGVSVIGSEIVGLVPSNALLDAAAYYLQLENFDSKQVLENRLYE